MKIVGIPALSDNYIWTVVINDTAIVIDAGDDVPVREFLASHHLTLSAILITHDHYDHIGGVLQLCQAYPDVLVVAHKEHKLPDTACRLMYVDEGSQFQVAGQRFDTWRTAGHTDTHVSYLTHHQDIWHVFCGDTLFSGGCGRVFTGTIEQLFDSVHRLARLPQHTLLYPAHEYTLDNLAFGLSVCSTKVKPKIEQAMVQIDQKRTQCQSSLPTTVAQQHAINVFLQTEDEQLIHNVAQRYPLANHTPLAVFTALRELKNTF